MEDKNEQNSSMGRYDFLKKWDKLKILDTNSNFQDN